MTIYEKIQTVRCELQSLNLKKTGKNEYSRFSYYELSDFLPQLNSLLLKNKLMTRVTFENKQAFLTVFDAEDSTQQVTFQSETAECEIGKKKDGSGGADPIQNLGGMITYMRRYLMMLAFEIVESDYVDKEMTKDLELDDEDLKIINSAENLTHLTSIFNKMLEKKGKRYTVAIKNACGKKKLEFGNENS